MGSVQAPPEEPTLTSSVIIPSPEKSGLHPVEKWEQFESYLEHPFHGPPGGFTLSTAINIIEVIYKNTIWHSVKNILSENMEGYHDRIDSFFPRDSAAEPRIEPPKIKYAEKENKKKGKRPAPKNKSVTKFTSRKQRQKSAKSRDTVTIDEEEEGLHGQSLQVSKSEQHPIVTITRLEGATYPNGSELSVLLLKRPFFGMVKFNQGCPVNIDLLFKKPKNYSTDNHNYAFQRKLSKRASAQYLVASEDCKVTISYIYRPLIYHLY